MAGKPTTCSCCGKRTINGLNYTYGGKLYCYSCFKAMQPEVRSTEDEKQTLYQYIRQLFAITEIPDEVLSFISHEVANGKKYNGIRLTLHYYYEILEHSRSAINTVTRVIREQYENAREYEKEKTQLKKINEQVDLSNTPEQIVRIPASELHKDRSKNRKTKYRIEDL